MAAIGSRFARVVSAVGLTGLVSVALAAPASAHVEGRATSVTPDGLTTVQFSYEHGCGTSPTTGLRTQLPAGTTDVSAVTGPSGWSGAVDGDVLAWTGPAVANGKAATYTVTMRLVGTKGDVVFLPTIQQCETGTNDWIQLPQAGQPEPEYVAPSVTLLATVAAPPTTEAPTTEAPATSSAGTTPAAVLGAAATPTQASSSDDGVPVGLLVGV